MGGDLLFILSSECNVENFCGKTVGSLNGNVVLWQMVALLILFPNKMKWKIAQATKALVLIAYLYAVRFDRYIQ